MHYPSTKLSKYYNCTVKLSKYDKENQGIHFHHYRQVHLIHYFGREQTPLLMHVIQCRIRIRPGYLLYKPGQTHLTRTKRDLVDLDNPDNPTRFQPWTMIADRLLNLETLSTKYSV